jgi:integrase
MSDMAMAQLIRGMNARETKWIDRDGRPVVGHGFRSSFRDWCEEATSAPRAVSEAALAHVVADRVEAAYRRTDLFDKRRELMNLWAAYCDGAASA